MLERLVGNSCLLSFDELCPDDLESFKQQQEFVHKHLLTQAMESKEKLHPAVASKGIRRSANDCVSV